MTQTIYSHSFESDMFTFIYLPVIETENRDLPSIPSCLETKDSSTCHSPQNTGDN